MQLNFNKYNNIKKKKMKNMKKIWDILISNDSKKNNSFYFKNQIIYKIKLRI